VPKYEKKLQQEHCNVVVILFTLDKRVTIHMTLFQHSQQVCCMQMTGALN